MLIQTIAILAINHVGTHSLDRYSGFSARYEAFGMNPFRPIPWHLFPKEGKDVTSCLYARRSPLMKILHSAKAPAKFGESYVRLWVQAGKDEWFIDEDGVVRGGRGDFALDDKAYERLRFLIMGSLPYNGLDGLRPPFKRNVQYCPAQNSVTPIKSL
jgi:hypothetical protein